MTEWSKGKKHREAGDAFSLGGRKRKAKVTLVQICALDPEAPCKNITSSKYNAHTRRVVTISEVAADGSCLQCGAQQGEACK